MRDEAFLLMEESRGAPTSQNKFYKNLNFNLFYLTFSFYMIMESKKSIGIKLDFPIHQVPSEVFILA